LNNKEMQLMLYRSLNNKGRQLMLYLSLALSLSLF
jgi:hypothetical protein